jgi:hypothetical protein
MKLRNSRFLLMSRMAWMVSALVLPFGCASAEPVVASASPRSPTEAGEPVVAAERFSDVAPEDVPGLVSDSSPSGPSAKGPDDATKRVMEEYKALALKNDCSRGKTDMAGTWKFVGESKTPEFASTIKIDGTRYHESITGKPDGKSLAATLAGEIRCVFKNRVLIQIDKVKPEGAYGNNSGDLYPCDVLSDMDRTVDRMLIICYFDWDLRTAAGLEFEYERVEPK